MTRFRSFGLAALAVLSLASAAVAQQRVPTANDQTGRTANAAPAAIVVAPAGGVSGKGRPVAEDRGIPVQGRDTVTGLTCAIGPTATCQLPGSGGGGGGGAVTVASGADVVQGATTDTLTTNTIFGNLQALKSVQGALGDAACATDNGSCTLKASIQRIAQRITSLIAAVGSPLQAGGSVAATVASGADVVQGATTDTAATNSVFGALLAMKAAAQDTTTEVPEKVADGSNVTLGAKADAAAAADTSTASLIALTKRLAQRLSTLDTDLATLHTDMGLPIPAGTAIIGKVTTDQTTHGTTDLIASDITKLAGTAIVNGGVAGSLGVGGPSAANVTPTENPVLGGCEFKTTTTAATTTQKQFVACGDGFGNLGQSITPAMATQITAQSATTGNTANTATLAAAAGKLTYITGFVCTAGGATTGQLATVTLAGIVTGSKTYTVAIPTGATLAMTPLIVSFPRPIQGSAVNTAITVAIGAAGTGNTAEQCNADGLQQ